MEGRNTDAVGALDLIADGTAVAMEHLFRERRSPFLGRLNNWTGRYSWSDELVTHDPGFHLGRLFLLFRHTGDERFLHWGLEILEPMVPELTKKALPNAMAGSEIYYGLCWAADITSDERWQSSALDAAENLIRTSWDAELRQFRLLASSRSQAVDTSGFLFSLAWARHVRDELWQCWRSHHHAVLDLGFLRPDGSCFHIAQLDDDGRVVRFTTSQGYEPSSTWSRAQSWAMHGFTAAYESSGEQRFKEAAIATADWWIANLGVSPVPAYDEADPDASHRPRDSCAAAMAANALLRLCALAPETQARYRPVVEATLGELFEWYLGAGGVLLHGSWGNRREPAGHGIAPRRLRFPQEDVMPYGNYFVVELSYRLLHEDTPPFGLSSPSAAAPKPSSAAR